MPHCNNPQPEHFLAIAQSLKGGGVERALLRLAQGWVAAGRRVTLVIGVAEGPLAHELPEGAEVIVLGTASYLGVLRALPEVAAKAAPDVFFCPGNHYTAMAGWMRLRLGRAAPPIVAKLSNALVRPELSPGAAWRYRRWLRVHPRFVDRLVALTPGMAAEATREMGMPADRISVIANPPALPARSAAGLPLPEGRFLLGVGRLEPQKRWDRLIAALPRLPDDVALLILGEGSERAALEAQAVRLGVGERVLLPGYAQDPSLALARAAAVALTSDFEGMPGVLREALALGTPVVATDSSVAVRELIASPALGSVVPREDPAGLVEALRYWLSPETVRPAPVADSGDPVAEYLALFDRVAAQRSR